MNVILDYKLCETLYWREIAGFSVISRLTVKALFVQKSLPLVSIHPNNPAPHTHISFIC